MKITWQVSFVLTCLFLLVAPGCRDVIYSPFFNPPDPPDPSFPVIGLELFTESGGGLEDDCSTLLNRADSVFLLEIQVGRPKPERLTDIVERIELEVSVGLMESGLVLADTAGYVVDTAGEYLVELPLELSDSTCPFWWKGELFSTSKADPLIPIIAITRYLDQSGYLVLLELPLEISDSLWKGDIFSTSKGDTLISIIAITRYLDRRGYLMLPMGRKIHNCIMKW